MSVAIKILGVLVPHSYPGFCAELWKRGPLPEANSAEAWWALCGGSGTGAFRARPRQQKRGFKTQRPILFSLLSSFRFDLTWLVSFFDLTSPLYLKFPPDSYLFQFCQLYGNKSISKILTMLTLLLMRPDASLLGTSLYLTQVIQGRH